MANPNLITKTFVYKLRTNRSFVNACEQVLDDARFVYNCALEQRVSYYRQTRQQISLYEQSRQLTEARRELPEIWACQRAIQQDSLERLDLAFKAFFRRLKQPGVKAGFPRFKARDRYHTFSQQFGAGQKCPLQGDKLNVPGVGSSRVRLSRPIEGKVKRVCVTRRASGWYALLVCDIPRPEPLPKTGLSVGVDVGLARFATLSTGEQIPNPRYLANASRRLIKAQRNLSRKKIGSAKRMKARGVVARQHERVVNARQDFHHKVSCDLVRRFDVITVEKLNIQALVRNHRLAKSISDVAWAGFFNITQAKAENAGRVFRKTAARFTSQTCSECGRRQKIPLAVRVFECESCIHVMDRDINASINIRRGAPVKPVESRGTRRSRNRQLLTPNADSEPSLCLPLERSPEKQNR